MTEILRRPKVEQEPLSRRTSVSSGEVWTVDLRPLVQTPASWFGTVLDRAVFLHEASLVRPSAVKALAEVLADSVWVGAPEPFVSSTDAGGISAEFDTPTLHMTIEAEADGQVDGYVAL